MKQNPKQSRTPLLNALRKAFQIAQHSQEPGSPPVNELIEMQQENSLHRRRFIGDVFKTGVVIGAAGLLDACRKVNDFIPPDATTVPSKVRGKQPKIVIVGAGMSGLNCAYELYKSGYSSSVYEGSTRSGGRMFSKRDILAQGLYTELGGEFIDSEHKDMIRLCNEFGLNLLDTRTREESALARDSFFINGRFHSEAEVINAFQPYASRIAADINSLADVMTYDDYDPATLRFDHISIHDYLDSVGMTGFLREGIETAYLTEYGLETQEQSSINFLYLFSPETSKGFDIFGTSDERYKIEGGNQTLTNLMYKLLENQVFMERKLVRIKQEVTGYSLYFTNANGSTEKVAADIVVMTIPFSVLREVELDVELPDWKTNAIKNIGYGTNAKLLLGFNNRVWRNYKYTGYVFTDTSIQSGWDNSWAQPGKKGGFTVYQGGRKGVELGAGTPEMQAPAFVAQLEKMWPGAARSFNGNAKRMHWPSYPFTKGSYSCYKLGQYTTIRGAEVKPIGNLYFAGEHCSANFQGFMNGAAETGRKAAHNVIKAIKVGDTVMP